LSISKINPTKVEITEREMSKKVRKQNHMNESEGSLEEKFAGWLMHLAHTIIAELEAGHMPHIEIRKKAMIELLKAVEDLVSRMDCDASK
jgi:hypothetical protein